MKYIFLFLPFFAFGQSDVVSDSSYLTNSNGKWFSTYTVTYADGGSLTRNTLIGDTSQTYNQLKDGILNGTAGRAVDVSTVSLYGRRNREDLRLSDEFLAKAGISVVDSIEAQNLEPFLQAGWTMKTPLGNVPISFNKTNAGKLRYQYQSTTNRQTDLMGAVIRLKEFPTAGTTTGFYRDPSGKRWVNLDRSFVLIAPGGSGGQNRR